LRFAPLNAAAALFDGDDGNRVFTGSQQSTSGMFTRPFAPNKNHEFLPILLFLNHQIGFSKFILEVGLCTHANLQARTQPVVITRWLAKQPSVVTHCKLPGIVVTSLHFHNEAVINTHANCKHQKQPFMIAQSLPTSQASHHLKIFAKQLHINIKR
jgi:hypothetical protein